MAPTLSVLTRQRDFRYLFLAELVVFGGDWFVLIPLVTLLQELTGSGLPGAIALAADTAVGALVLPLAGTFADRMNRRTLMIAANIGAIVAVTLLFAVRSAELAWIGPLGIGLAAASLLVMPLLSYAQRRAGREYGSVSAVADSKQTLLCTYLSGVLLVGLLANATLGWWWADPVAALVIAAVAVKEGREAWRGDTCCSSAAALASPERSDVDSCGCGDGCRTNGGSA